MVRSRTGLIAFFMATLLALSLAAPVSGDIIWTGGAANDNFNDNANWDALKPTATDNAVFNIPVNVVFLAAEASLNLTITANAGVSFSLGLHTYTLGDTLRIGTTAGDVASLSLFGAGATIAAVNGNIGQAANATGTLVVNTGVTFSVTNNLTVGDAGTGVLELSGGTVEVGGGMVLGNASTGDGTVDVSEGLLTVSGGNMHVGGSGTGSLTIESGGSVNVTNTAFVGSDGGTGTATVTGPGALAGGGGGVWNITGNLTIGRELGAEEEPLTTGTLIVQDGGQVVVNGASGLTIDQTGLLTGDGGFIQGNVFVHGTIAPGASIGTMNIDGGLTLQEDGTYAADFNGENSDQILVSGQVTLDPGTTIALNNLGADVVIGQSLDVIISQTGVAAPNEEGAVTSGAGGVNITDTTEGANPLIAWLGFLVDEDTDFLLRLIAHLNAESLDEFATTPNQHSLVGGLDNLPNDHPLLPFVTDPDTAGAALASLVPLQYSATSQQIVRTGQAFNTTFTNEMSAIRIGLRGLALGSGNDSAPAVMLASAAHDPAYLAQAIQAIFDQSDEYQMGTALDSLRHQPQWGGYVRGMGIWESVEADVGRAGHRGRVVGVQVGFHNHLSHEFLLGITGGYLNSDLKFDGGMGDAETHTIRIGPYLSWSPGGGDLFVDAAMTYGFHRNEVSRNPVGGPTNGRFNAHDLSAFGQVGLDINVWKGTVFTPLIGVDYMRLWMDSYTETGGPGASHFASTTRDSLRTRVGARVTQVWDFGALTIVPEVYAGWAREHLDRDVDVTTTFVGAPGSTFITRGTGVGRDELQVAAGASVLLDTNLSLFLRYEGAFQSDRKAHGLVGGVAFNF